MVEAGELRLATRPFVGVELRRGTGRGHSQHKQEQNNNTTKQQHNSTTTQHNNKKQNNNTIKHTEKQQNSKNTSTTQQQQHKSKHPAHSQHILPPGADVGMILQPSCKMFSHFLRGLYEGRWDTVINEIEAQDMKNLSALAIFEYPKFGMADAQAMYRKEKIQQESASRFAAMPSSGSQPVQVDVEEEDLPQQAADIPEGAAGGEVDAEDDDIDEKKQQGLKEKTLEQA